MNAKRLFFYPFPIYFAKTSHNNRPVVTTMCPSYLGGASLDFALMIMHTYSCYRLKKMGGITTIGRMGVFGHKRKQQEVL